MIRDHVERPRHRKGGNRRAAGQRLELHDAERIGAARKHEDVRSRQMRGQIRAGLFAEKSDTRIFVLERRLLRSVADHDLGSRQVERKKSFDILFDGDAAHGHEDRARQVELERVIRIEKFGVDAAAPEAELAKAARGELVVKRVRRHHRHGGGRMKTPQHRIAHRRRNDGADRDIFRKARRIGRREGKPAAAAIGPCRPADRPLGRNMNRVGGGRLDPARDLAPVWQGNAQARIGRHRRTEGNPSGVRKSTSTPSADALRFSEVRVRTTPLTCGCQASVAIKIRIAGILW